MVNPLNKKVPILALVLITIGFGEMSVNTPMGGLSVVNAADSSVSKPIDDSVLVRIGDRTITRQAVDQRVRKMSQKRRRKPSEEEVATFVDQLVEQTLFAEEARSLGLDKDPQVQMMIQETLDKMLANLYVYRHLLPGVTVSDAEIADYYRKHQGEWKEPETVHARHILLRVDRQATGLGCAKGGGQGP